MYQFSHCETEGGRKYGLARKEFRGSRLWLYNEVYQPVNAANLPEGGLWPVCMPCIPFAQVFLADESIKNEIGCKRRQGHERSLILSFQPLEILDAS